jgi:chromosome segregation ATPase
VQELKNQLESSVRKEEQLFTKAMELESQLEEKNSKVNNLQLQIGQLQANNQSMLQMLEGY